MLNKFFFVVLIVAMFPHALSAESLTPQNVIDANTNECCSFLMHHRSQRKTKTTYPRQTDLDGHESVLLSKEVFEFDKAKLGAYQRRLQERANLFELYADDAETKGTTYCYALFSTHKRRFNRS